mmetsp:Transcript_3658/g.12839  ORF Transcript_3658/g.12839 Transcript_3658/m.12839 type:complete len:538 (+) Transcript_3658:65-1678(+)
MFLAAQGGKDAVGLRRQAVSDDSPQEGVEVLGAQPAEGLLLALSSSGGCGLWLQHLDVATVLCDPRVPDELKSRGPFIPVVRQGLEDEALGERGHHPVREWHVALKNPALGPVVAIQLAAERRVSDQELVQQHADRPHVHALVVPRLPLRCVGQAGEVTVRRTLPLRQQRGPQLLHLVQLPQVGVRGTPQQLGGHVVHGAHPDRRGGNVRVDGEAKIAQLDLEALSGPLHEVLVVPPLRLPPGPAPREGAKHGGTPPRFGAGGLAAGCIARVGVTLLGPVPSDQLGLDGVRLFGLPLISFRPAGQQDVLWLDVPVHYAPGVQVHEQAQERLDDLGRAPSLVGVQAVEGSAAVASRTVLEVELLAQGEGLDHPSAELPEQVSTGLLLLHQVVARPVLQGGEERDDVHAPGVVPVNENLAPHVPVVHVLHPLLLVHLEHDDGDLGRVAVVVAGRLAERGPLADLAHHPVPLPGRDLPRRLQHECPEDLGHLARSHQLDGFEGVARPVVLHQGLHHVPGAKFGREREVHPGRGLSKDRHL